MKLSTSDRAEKFQVAWVVLAAIVAVGVVAIGYPMAIDRLQAGVGTRALAGTLALIFGVAVIRQYSGERRDTSAVGSRGIGVSIGLLATLLAALVLDDARYLRLVPALVYLGLALFCFGNAREEESLLERGVRYAIPGAPPFIRGYCRGLTAVWGVFFFVCAAAIATLALSATPERWRVFTARDVWIAMAGLSLVEFFVRKTWFRYYYWNGPFERFWSRLFPAERTASGRRSLAYIEAYRERVARERAGSAEARVE